MQPNYATIPQELRQRRQWLPHKKKVPQDPKTGKNAHWQDPNTWRTFAEVIKDCGGKRYDGFGFVFTADDPYFCVDFDHCLTDGKITDPAISEKVTGLKSYTEVSYSGTGLHVICKGELEGNVHKALEMYKKDRFMTFSGVSFGEPLPIAEATEYAAKLYREQNPTTAATGHTEAPDEPPERTNAEIVAEALKDPEFAKLHTNGDYEGFPLKSNGDPDPSQIDLIYCKKLCRLTKSATQIDEIYRESAICRPKWDERRGRGGTTYGTRTITAAFKALQRERDEILADFANLDTPADAPAPAGLSVISASDLVGKQLDPIRFFVDGFIPQGLSILSAPPKYGKSWFVLDLCLSVCRGSEFLGMKTEKSDCLYLALEDSMNRLQSRMRKVLGDSIAPNNLDYAIQANTLDTGLMQQLESYYAEHPNAGLIVIDTFQKIRGASGRNEGAYKYDYRETGMLKAFADRHKIAILLVHHLRKMADDADPHNRISGTNGIMGAADTSIVLTRTKRGDENTTLSLTGRDVDTAEYELSFDTDACRWKVLGDSAVLYAQRKEKEYRNDPFVQTISYLLNNSKDKQWRGSLSKLITASKGFPFQINETPTKLSRRLKDLEPELEYNSGITFETWSKGKNGGGRTYTFYLSEDFGAVDPTEDDDFLQ